MTPSPATAGAARSVGRIRVVASRLVAAAVVLAAVTWSGCGGEGSAPQPQESEPVTTTTFTGSTVETGIGQPVDTGSFLVEILSVGAADLEMLPPSPEPGHHFLGLLVEVVNQGDDGVPLNAIPYAASTATLVADDVEYPGKLFIRPGPLLDGEVPPGRPIGFSFVFEIPDDTVDGMFVWSPVPAVSGYPRIMVAIPEDALRPE